MIFTINFLQPEEVVVTRNNERGIVYLIFDD